MILPAGLYLFLSSINLSNRQTDSLMLRHTATVAALSQTLWRWHKIRGGGTVLTSSWISANSIHMFTSSTKVLKNTGWEVREDREKGKERRGGERARELLTEAMTSPRLSPTSNTKSFCRYHLEFPNL